MRIPLGKALRWLLGQLKGKHIKVGGVDIELDKQHEFPYEGGPVNEGLSNPDERR